MTEHIYAIIADIHGNYPALQAVERDAREWAQQEQADLVFICLGDTVDYGPQPNECMDWVMKNVPARFRLRGNHDDDASREGWLKPAREDDDWFPMTMWTRLTLTAEHKETLRICPEVANGVNSLGKFLFFHNWPTPNPLRRIDDAGNAGDALPLLGNGRCYGAFGHTHFQTLFEKRKNRTIVTFSQPEDHCEGKEDGAWAMCANKWQELPSRSALINPGSVGQPRHMSEQLADTRAEYLQLRSTADGTFAFQWRRVAYEAGRQETIERLRQLRWPEDQPSHNPGKAILKQPRSMPDPSSFSPSELEELEQQFPVVVEELIRRLRIGR